MDNVNKIQTSKLVKKQEGQLGQMARYYDLITAFMTFGREKAFRQVTIKLARVMPGDKVLEVGCGTGTLTLAAKARVGSSGEVVGIDIAPEMVAAASRKTARKGIDISFRAGSIESIPFPDNRFDVVICSFMIFHMPDDVRGRGFKEVYRILKPGGHLFIVDFSLPDKTWQRHFVQMHLGHMMQHDVRELAPVLKDNFFTEIEMGRTKFLGTWFLRGKVEK
jgi:demethylmenaquinone methyltransferase/2-methoxy-6-polyprenyl-1,4-benzoquinol methylase/phosphoethanolamine N-methyltransferase